jgi:TolA-binding protein
MEPAVIRLRLATFLLLATAAVPALAQPKPTIDQRVDKVEKELRAVQRKVFPGGSPAFFEPEIAPPSAAQAPATMPSNAALNDLSARVDALERTVAQLTGQIEQDEHRVTLLSEQAAKDRSDFDARLKAIEAAAAPAPSEPAPPFMALPAPATPKPGKPGALVTAPGPKAATASAPVKPAATKAAPTKPVVAPAPDDAPPLAAASTGDAGEDAYLAAYKLWADKKYPQAQTALKAFVAKYPKHKRTSYAQNLLGRAFLDDNRPANAAEAFATNYQTNPRGDRAQESLYYLGQSLTKLNKPADACRVYDELDTAYGDKVSDSLKARIATARKDAKCK